MNRSQILQAAKLTAALQFHPQIQTLVQQRQLADQSLATGIAAQAAAARAIAAAAQSARRPMKRTFDNEVKTNAAVNQRIAGDLANTGPSADAFRGALDSEAGLATTLATRGRSQALRGLSDLATNAAKGRAYAVLNLLTQHNQDVRGLNQKIQGLQGEQGAAQAKGYLTLLGQEQSRAISRGNLTERKRHDLAIENKSGSGGSSSRYKATHGGFSQAEVLSATGKAKDAIREAQTWLGRLVNKHNTVQDVMGLLTTGGKVPVPAPPYKDGTPRQVLQPVPKIGAVYVRAALELSRGSLSPGTVHELRSRAVHVPASWLPPTYRPGMGPSQGARPYGQRPT